MDLVKHFIAGFHLLLSVGLIALIVAQTSRSEGLGAMGGQSSAPTARGSRGLEEQLAFITRWLAGAWLLLSLIRYLLASKYGWT